MLKCCHFLTLKTKCNKFKNSFLLLTSHSQTIMGAHQLFYVVVDLLLKYAHAVIEASNILTLPNHRVSLSIHYPWSATTRQNVNNSIHFPPSTDPPSLVHVPQLLFRGHNHQDRSPHVFRYTDDAQQSSHFSKHSWTNRSSLFFALSPLIH